MERFRLFTVTALFVAIFALKLTAPVYGQILDIDLPGIDNPTPTEEPAPDPEPTDTQAADPTPEPEKPPNPDQNNGQNEQQEDDNRDNGSSNNSNSGDAESNSGSSESSSANEESAQTTNIPYVAAAYTDGMSITPTGTATPTPKKKQAAKTPNVKIFSYKEAFRPVAFGSIILFAALGIVFFRNHSMTLDTYLRRAIALARTRMKQIKK